MNRITQKVVSELKKKSVQKLLAGITSIFGRAILCIV